MAYTDETVKSKLSTLNETQESIMTVAQWIMFHKKYADRSAAIWLEKMKDAPPSKRLVLLYLVNEVVQQSKNRKKDDFLTAFSPIIVEATVTAYKSASGDTQSKLRRVIEVWRARSIFDAAILDAIDSEVAAVDKAGSSGRKTLMGGSLFSSGSSSVPSEIQALSKLQTDLSKASLGLQTAINNANSDYEAATDSSKPTPSQPVHARQLGLLVNKLGSAEAAVTKSLEARKAIVAELEKLIETNRASVADLEEKRSLLATRKAEMLAKHQEVEDQIMKGLPPADEEANAGYTFSDDTHQRPQEEPLTPPAIESFTPPDPPTQIANFEPPPMDLASPNNGHVPTEEVPMDLSTAQIVPIGDLNESGIGKIRPRPSSSSGATSPPLVKRRKASSGDDDIPGFSGGDALEGLDEDVVGMLQ